MPAWVVSQANQYAKDHGKTPFVVYQGAWNIMERSFERDIIPMARSLGMYGFEIVRSFGRLGVDSTSVKALPSHLGM